MDAQRFATREEATIRIFHYLGAWYNPRRRHSALQYASPIEYERRFAKAFTT